MILEAQQKALIRQLSDWTRPHIVPHTAAHFRRLSQAVCTGEVASSWHLKSNSIPAVGTAIEIARTSVIMVVAGEIWRLKKKKKINKNLLNISDRAYRAKWHTQTSQAILDGGLCVWGLDRCCPRFSVSHHLLGYFCCMYFYLFIYFFNQNVEICPGPSLFRCAHRQ